MFGILLVISTLGALASAGGKTLSPRESRQFLDMFQRYCSNRGATPPSQDGGKTSYYCKFPDGGPITRNVDHESELRSSESDGGRQVIFVQPPSHNYIHNLALRGDASRGQETDIYVLPSPAEHQLEVQQLERPAPQPQKPSLYFLSESEQFRGDPRSSNLRGSLGVGGGGGGRGLSSSSSPSSSPPIGILPFPSKPSIGILPFPSNPPLRPSAQQPPQLNLREVAGVQQQSSSPSYGAPAPSRFQRNIQRNFFTPYTTLR